MLCGYATSQTWALQLSAIFLQPLVCISPLPLLHNQVNVFQSLTDFPLRSQILGSYTEMPHSQTAFVLRCLWTGQHSSHPGVLAHLLLHDGVNGAS